MELVWQLRDRAAQVCVRELSVGRWHSLGQGSKEGSISMLKIFTTWLAKAKGDPSSVGNSRAVSRKTPETSSATFIIVLLFLTGRRRRGCRYLFWSFNH